jgi:SAM-dependent methyltransferase
MAADVISLTACPACGSGDARNFTIAHVSKRRCRGCGLVYAATVADPTTIYRDGYLTGRSEYGPDTTDPIVVAIARAAAHRRFEIIERVRGTGTVLDVGCGSGEALDVARQRGWSGVGVEPVAGSAERARRCGLEIRTGTLSEAGLPQASFDLVAAWHVLEHLLDPVSFLSELARHARPGGLVAVEVPNWRHRSRRVEGPDWDQLCPLEHVAHFTPGTLRRTMQRAGLRPHMRTVTIVRPNRIVDALGFGFAVVAIGTIPQTSGVSRGPRGARTRGTANPCLHPLQRVLSLSLRRGALAPQGAGPRSTA